MLTATAIASDDRVSLNEILNRHGIALPFRQAFQRLIQSGEIINADFRTRLNTCRNFQECADEVLRVFPQPDRVYVRENPPRFKPFGV